MNPRLTVLSLALVGALLLRVLDPVPEATSAVQAVSPAAAAPVTLSAGSSQRTSVQWPVRQPIESTVVDVFGGTAPVPLETAPEVVIQPPPAAPTPPVERPFVGPLYEPEPPIVIPPIPFAVLGAWIETGGQLSAFLSSGDKVMAVKQGDEIDSIYSVVNLQPGDLTVLHKPSGQTQSITWTSTP